MTAQLAEVAPLTSAPDSPRRRGKRPAGGHWWVYLILTVGLVAVISPFIWMLVSSIKPSGEIMQVPPTWLPSRATLENYQLLFQTLHIPTYLLNSVLVATVVTLGNIVFCSMAGYALAKIDFAGRRLVLFLVLGILMVPGMVTFVPLFILVSNLGLTNTYAGLILPFLAGPIGIFLMRQFISGLPDELIDAARVDGAGEFRIFARIIMPLCGPAIATLGILTFLGSWNSFLWPLVVAQTEDKYTLPVALAVYSIGQNATEYGLLLSGAVVIVVPMLLVFLALQRYFVHGIATTGIK